MARPSLPTAMVAMRPGARHATANTAKDSLLPHFRGWRGWIAVILLGNSTHLHKAAVTMKRWRPSQRRCPLTSGKPLRHSMLDWALPRSKSRKSWQKTVAIGRSLADRGDWSQALPGCGACHGAAGQGVGKTFPKLAGQSGRIHHGPIEGMERRQADRRPLAPHDRHSEQVG